MNSLNILFVTGTRADFGKIEPVAVQCIKRGHKVTFFTTGMHQMKSFGMTRLEVERVANASSYNFTNQTDGDDMELVLTKTISGLSDYLANYDTDLVIAHGDRVEAFAASIVCAIKYVKMAHIEGGEVSGTIDEMFRHCNTKLSAVHFVSSEEAKNRVLRLGEEDRRVFCVGSPELDRHKEPSGVDISDVRKRYNINFEEYGIFIFHSVTSELANLENRVDVIFTGLEACKRKFVVIQPNNDPGSEVIRRRIEKLDTDYFRVLPNMRFSHFSELIKNTKLFVGNSSAGVREVPFFGVPSIDIGTRQTNRSKADSIHPVSNSDLEKIPNLIHSLWGKKYASDSSFGAGNSAERIVDIIEADDIWQLPMQKYFSDN